LNFDICFPDIIRAVLVKRKDESKIYLIHDKTNIITDLKRRGCCGERNADRKIIVKGELCSLVSE
jgi:hypothetical protein